MSKKKADDSTKEKRAANAKFEKWVLNNLPGISTVKVPHAVIGLLVLAGDVREEMLKIAIGNITRSSFGNSWGCG